MAVSLSPFNRSHRDPVRKRREPHASAALVAIGFHLFIAYVAFTMKLTRSALEHPEKDGAITWITLAVPLQPVVEKEPVPTPALTAPTGRGVNAPVPAQAPAAEPPTAITPPTVPGLEVLGEYVACGLRGIEVETMQKRANCEGMRAALGDGKAGIFVQTPEERALWAKFAQDKAVQEAGVFSVCSNRGGVTVALTIRIVGGAWFIGDASNARRRADTNMLDDANMNGMPQFGCDTPEGALFKPRHR